MPTQLTLNETQIEALAMLLDYCWNDEREDYRDCSHEPGGNQREGHIFESLVILANLLDGTDKTPEDNLNE